MEVLHVSKSSDISLYVNQGLRLLEYLFDIKHGILN